MAVREMSSLSVSLEMLRCFIVCPAKLPSLAIESFCKESSSALEAHLGQQNTEEQYISQAKDMEECIMTTA